MKQKGFTLIELLVALGVGAVVLTGIVISIFMVMRGATEIKAESVALADIGNAAHWLARDVVMGQSTDLLEGAPPADNITITWTDFTGGGGDEIFHYVTYTYSGTELLREYDSANNTTIVGRHLTDVSFSIDGSLVTVILTCYKEGVPRSTVTRQYIIQMRAKSET